MKIKVGDKIYNAHDQPIMVILNPKDKENLAKMSPDNFKYVGYPEGYDLDELLDWMQTDTTIEG